MHAHVAFLVRWNRNAALLALLVIVAIGLLSCSGGTSGGGGGDPVCVRARHVQQSGVYIAVSNGESLMMLIEIRVGIRVSP